MTRPHSYNGSGPFWERFEQEADQAYSYLVANVDHMIKGKRVLHFSIQPSWNGSTIRYYEQIKQAHQKELEGLVILWVRQERDAGRLFIRENWKTYRHTLDHTASFIGYRGLFCFKEYVFQLSVDLYDWDDDCIDCLLTEPSEDIPHFEAMVYGRKGEVEEGWISDEKWRRH